MAHASQGLLWLLSHAVPDLDHMPALLDRCGHEHGITLERSRPRQAIGWPQSSSQTPQDEELPFAILCDTPGKLSTAALFHRLTRTLGSPCPISHVSTLWQILPLHQIFYFCRGLPAL